MLKITGLPAEFADCDLEDFFSPYKINFPSSNSSSNRAAGIAFVEMPDNDPTTVTDELRQKKFKGQYLLEFEPHPDIGGGLRGYDREPSNNQPKSVKPPEPVKDPRQQP